jgi:uncharacterized membrane protein HdeD (DUF308 family)
MESTQTDTDMTQVYPDWGWKGLLALGLVMVLGGVLAFLNPFAASLTVEVVAGAVFLAAGLIELWWAVTERQQETSDRLLMGALGAMLVLLAVSLLLNPLAGLVTLTLVVAILFVMVGALRIAMAWRTRPARGWGWIMASGVMSLALAALILLALPEAALGLLGIFLGIDLVMAGSMTLALAWARKDGDA